MKEPDPDVPVATIADLRWRLDHNYVIFQPQIRELLEAFDRLRERHQTALRHIKKAQVLEVLADQLHDRELMGLKMEVRAWCGESSTTVNGSAPT